LIQNIIRHWLVHYWTWNWCAIFNRKVLQCKYLGIHNCHQTWRYCPGLISVTVLIQPSLSFPGHDMHWKYAVFVQDLMVQSTSRKEPHYSLQLSYVQCTYISIHFYIEGCCRWCVNLGIFLSKFPLFYEVWDLPKKKLKLNAKIIRIV
jgi:hypothetical protein